MTVRETPVTPVIGEQATPLLLNVVQSETETPEWALMDETRRSELIEELIAWSGDADGLDWGYVDSKD